MLTRNMVIVGVVVIVAGILFFRGVSKTNTASSPASPPTPAVTASASDATSAASAQTEGTVINITSSGFNPGTVTIKIDDKVTWINNDSVVHQVNSSSHPTHTDYSPLNTIDLLKPGEKKSLAFPTKGVYKFHDHLNPQMFGSITVE